jgi:hypothetical protein
VEGSDWIKFFVVSIVFALGMWAMAPTYKWKVISALAAFGGTFLAIEFGSMRRK